MDLMTTVTSYTHTSTSYYTIPRIPINEMHIYLYFSYIITSRLDTVGDFKKVLSSQKCYEEAIRGYHVE